MSHAGLRVYWANALFTDAERSFNLACATRLRGCGHTVFLPQEAKVNHAVEPTAEQIFRVDTAEVLASNVIVACLDQEPIDSGVACEIGIAWTWGIPIIGLYTDIRQHRTGPGRMYKNLYVVGAVETVGAVAGGVDEVIDLLAELNSGAFPEQRTIPAAEHFGEVASTYDDFVGRLARWYTPGWNALEEVLRFMPEHPPRILEYGCGTGWLGTSVVRARPDASYIGYDPSAQMIAQARERGADIHQCTFTADADELAHLASGSPFDLIFVGFALHDCEGKEAVLAELSKWLRPRGILLILDLSKQDLPALTNLLRTELVRPLGAYDGRIDPALIVTWARQAGLAIEECRLALPTVSFPSADDILCYLDTFGVFRGMDLPLGIRAEDSQRLRELVAQLMQRIEFPFIDQRVFVVCALTQKVDV